jgi:hypothetical protein
MSAFRDYKVFGLKVRSAIPLPELFPSEVVADPDITIRAGSVPTSGESPGLHTHDGGQLLVIPGIARYRIAGGNEIIVDPAPDVPERNVRLFLLGSAFGALLHQRGLLPLHANAIELEGKAVAFMGKSGSGKSTLAAWFYELGFRIIADDVCVVGFAEAGHPYAAPGLPRLRLWAEVLELIGRGTAGFDRSYVSDAHEKFDMPVAESSAVMSKLRLAGLYLLDRADEFALEGLAGSAAAEAVFANTYRGSYLQSAGAKESHWRAAVRLVRSVPVFRASRPWNLKNLNIGAELLRAHALELVGSPGPVESNAGVVR